MLPGRQVVELIGKEKNWWLWRRRAELKRANEFLDTFTAKPGPPKAVLPAQDPGYVGSTEPSKSVQATPSGGGRE